MSTVQCDLCPKACVIAHGQSGDCRIRVNVDGRLIAVTYAHPRSVNVDPVEKKPLFHFLPGTGILSIATVGCNLHCKNCQNWQISQANPEESRSYHLPPERLPQLARTRRCSSVAYTYTDPMAYYEYALDGCIAVREAGLRNVLVTAGYINDPPLRKLCRYVDAANIDLKAFSDAFYRDVCDATLAPVLNTLVVAKSLGVLIEVTNLVIPTLNDSDSMLRDLSRWIARNLGRETPLHFSRFHPQYRFANLPPTPAATLDRARDIAVSEGLYHVYVGNLSRPDASDTFCHSCKERLISRRVYRIIGNRLVDGSCPKCGEKAFGIWK
jgi:pyruvate formate lyase activating enzyme